LNLKFRGSPNLQDFILDKILDHPVYPIKPALQGFGTVPAISDDPSASFI